MDPLSLTASLISIAGLVSAVTKSLHKLKNLYHAGEEIHALSNEISDLEAVFRNVAQAVQDGQHNGSPRQHACPNLSPNIQAAKDKLLELDMILNYRLIRPTSKDSAIKIDRMRWLKERAHVMRLQSELRNIRHNLTTQISALHSLDFSRVHLRLDEVSLITQELVNGQRSLHNDTNQRLEKLSEDVAQVQLLSENQSQTQRVVQTLCEQILIENQSGKEMRAGTSITQSLTSHISRTRGGNIQSKQINTFSAVRIKTSNYWGTPCRSGCCCACHKRLQLQTPRILDHLIGTLFMGYSGLPMITPSCDQPSCRQRSIPSTQMTYYFPRWFLLRAVSLAIMLLPNNGPVVSLRLQRTVSGSSKIFDYANVGDIDGMKRLFSSGQASPHDVRFDSGTSALQCAVDHDQVEMCQFLLSVKANASVEDHSYTSALDAAWTRIFSKGLAPDKEEVLRKLFDDTDCLEKRQFTLLHSLILGIEPGELETELLNSNIQQIDAVDSTGRTPLSWASSRGDIANVQKLLQHGANPNITSICGMSPLHYAVRPASCRCITPLLAAGARVDELTNWLQTPLHHAAAYKDDPQFLEALVDSGADVNARDRDGNTPLGCAALANHAKSAAFLLTCGANIDSQDFKGWTALLDAVDTNNHDVAKLLICEGADTALTLKEGDTVLHRAAERGDVETMDILNNAVSVGVDISARNVHGYRARDLLEKRSYVLQEMREAFERLEMSCLKEAEDKVLGPRAGDESPDEDTDKIQDDERFVDAVEFQIEDYF